MSSLRHLDDILSNICEDGMRKMKEKVRIVNNKLIGERFKRLNQAVQPIS